MKTVDDFSSSAATFVSTAVLYRVRYKCRISILHLEEVVRVKLRTEHHVFAPN